MSNDPSSLLLSLLKEHDITLEVFRKKGRPPDGVREKRSSIVTFLHRQGLSWAEMVKVTGLSQGSIQRLTKAKGCEKVQEKRKRLGTSVGRSWKGRKRPGQLEKQWEEGVFDSLRGRKRSAEEIENIRASWTPERKKAQAQNSRKNIWGNPETKERLLAFHRAPGERARRSREQTKRMLENPTEYVRGRREWVCTPKGNKDKVFVRSSYEKAAILALESDLSVEGYWFEPRIILPNGKWILPDFLVTYQGQLVVLVEVKAAWVLAQPPDTKVRKRLRVAQEIALQMGWSFEVWTEKELFDAL